MDDAYGEEALSESDHSVDEYEREQLEIALYSQIHFEENNEHLEHYNNNNSDDFVIDVQGNEKKGFTANETNSSIILNEGINKKYGNSVDAKGSISKERSPYIKTRPGAQKLKLSKNDSSSRSVRKLEKPSVILDSASKISQSTRKEISQSTSKERSQSACKEVSQSTKIQALLRDTSSSRPNKLSVEVLILGDDSENEDDAACKSDVEEVMLISDTDGDDVEVLSKSDRGDDDDVKVLSESNSDEDDVEVLSKSDSDLDSLDVVLGQSDSDTGDIQMNLHSNPRYTYKKMSHEDIAPCDEADNSDDAGHWAISREDSFKDVRGAAGSQGRYYKPIRCHNCNHVGHLSKNCPQPKKIVVCALCSEPGHVCRNCPQAMCFNCEEPGHESKTCVAPRRRLHAACYRCNMQGHDQNQCPDIWRQYHVTVTPGKIKHFSGQAKRKRTSCYNCGDDRHFGHECEEERMNKFLRVSTPFICRYNTVAQINDMVRRYDETEDRPIKRSRSENWSGNRGNRDNWETYKEKRNMKSSFDKDKDFSKKKPDQTNEKMNIGDSVGKNVKKPSSFTHIIKKHPGDNTGRNNFDKLQFTILNEKKQDDVKNMESAKSSEKINKKKPKKKKKKKDKNIDKSRMQTLDTQETAKEVLKGCSQGVDTGNREDESRKSQEKLKDGSNERKVTLNSSGMNLTIQAKRDFSEVFETGKSEKIVENKAIMKTVGFDEMKSGKWNKKKSRSCSMLEKMNFTVNREISTAKDNNVKSDNIQKKYSSVRNDILRPDDLFSLEKLQKFQSGHHVDLPVEEEDVDHQVDNNEWWRGKGKKKRRRKNKTKNRVCFY